ncbi:uncharacterized protein Z520_03028 [Fonsecaea multimorphosa CBS 102226]|uniref:Uncharacterized protein n=1 Tax=Fonsecaea multimorphosa CBS 102226 TaxID=1442371 RepID=A0A0D2HHW2_9EURO|nr:uncharacterized protein Z520_03028 [Fonsecaea multimorphosa CBS 102226]KIY01476.1 hypothetical protein Z520_03028 [Fonsecaea multimorphosa CBS 102226]OAL28240.1 hypothetical protein AYO22_02946 [Fonsecaea multimorphosa]
MALCSAPQTRGINMGDCGSIPSSPVNVPSLEAYMPVTIRYPRNHLLGIPQELRDTIMGLVPLTKRAIGSRPSTGCEIFHFVCRQTYHESSRLFNTQVTVLAPSNRVDEFLKRSLNINTIRSNTYQSILSLFLEIAHDSHSTVFLQLGEVLRRSSQLEELHLFGVGADGYGVKTSSAAYPCGKHGISIWPPVRKLPIDGQQYKRRLAPVNNIPWLGRLRVLVLDNLNLPLTQSHVLKNKPQLETLHIAADPRTVLHGEYWARPESTVGNLIFPAYESPPIKELRVDSNSVLSASKIIVKTSTTLESLDLVIPDMVFQIHLNKINFYQEASTLLHRLPMDAKQLRELRICVHETVSEEKHYYANFMGALKDCVSRMQSLQLIELHMHSDSPWFARELIEAVPPSVTRLYLSHLFVERDIQDLSGFISVKTETPLLCELEDAYAIGEDLQRKDHIKFSGNRLAFVGYEHNCLVRASSANLQEKAIANFLKLNGRLLDKERNRHLAHLGGSHIPFKKSGVIGHPETGEATSKFSFELPPRTQAKVEKYRKALDKCGLGDNEYFGNEDLAAYVFEGETAAKGGHYSYPAVVEVENESKFSNHWLSK